MSFHRIRSALAVLLLCLFALPAIAAGGKFQFVLGEVNVVTPAGSERRAERGMVVEEGDTVTSTHDAQAQILMDDGGVIAVRPGTSFRLKVYKWNGKEDGSENGVIELLRGALRSITGRIGKTNKDRYAVIALTATIGVRGTDHETVIVPAGQADAAGVYNKVYSGATFMRTPQGTIDIKPGQVGFVPFAGGAPRISPAPSMLRGGADKAGPRGAQKGDASKADAGKGAASPGGRPQQPGQPGAEMRPQVSGQTQPMTQPPGPAPQSMQPIPMQPVPMQPVPMQPVQPKPVQPIQPTQPTLPPLPATQPKP